FVRLCRLLRRLDPDIAHFITLRAVLYGSIAARLLGIPAVVNSITGLGHLFTDDGWSTRTLRWGVLHGLRGALGHPNQRTTFHNPNNAALFVDRGLVPEDEVIVTPGSGVDPEQFSYADEASVGDDGPLVMLATRLIWPKGIEGFVEAARHFQNNGTSAQFALVGDTDPENPASVAEEQVQAWSEAGLIDWWGYRPPAEMPRVLRQAHVVCLPSYYREGVPKVLIEAASTGRPIVTTDVPGCREIVDDGENGFLVPPQDPSALVDRLHTLLHAPLLRQKMGRKGRRRVEDTFTADRVATMIVNAYDDLQNAVS
ncbi:MAG: glycosyltransferase family 4 protein, partial [Salinibacter sp.]|uniref:glycosyltransferase family 4 protein n=2 Tax=Salinibacter sp. TaxID=2065818 RepID=UPI002FC29941